MKEELNLICPYNVFLDKDTFIYSFITKNQVEYKIIFSDSTSFYEGTSSHGKISKVYSLTVEKVTDIKEKHDTDVQATVDCIVTHFFEDKENSLIYMCDNSDSREIARYRKFNGWFANSPFKDNVIKINEQIESEDKTTTFYTSIVYHMENPFQVDLEIGYYEVIDTLRDK